MKGDRGICDISTLDFSREGGDLLFLRDSTHKGLMLSFAQSPGVLYSSMISTPLSSCAKSPQDISIRAWRVCGNGMRVLIYF